MRKTIIPFAIAALSFLCVPVLMAGSNKNIPVAETKVLSATTDHAAMDAAASTEAKAAALYEELGLEAMGLSRAAMNYAYRGYENLAAKGALPNEGILTIVDFSQSSHKKRMYIVDMNNREVLVNTYVAHGKNSGLEYAKKFSNVHESLASSLGFYVTKGTYFGKHGLSLRLDGRDKGFNDNAESRAVVVHGADYIGKHRLASAYQGRSFGCPAVPQAESKKIINLIKDGTCLFIYHPSQNYLDNSKVLNG